MSNYVYVECDITRQLDEALKNKANIIIRGLTGSGKTSITLAWLEHNEDKINGYYFDCAFFGEAHGDKHIKNGLTLYGQAFPSEIIDILASKPHRVIVLDNIRFLTKNVKQHMLLLCDKYVVDGREESGYKKLDNIDFVCFIETTGL